MPSAGAGPWPEQAFGSLLLGTTRNGLYKPPEFHGDGVPIVNMGELFAYPRFRPVDMRRISVRDDEVVRFALQPGDLLFARRSLVAEGAGKCSVVLRVDEPTVFESSIIRARPDPARFDGLFGFYLFCSPIGLHKLDTIRRQVAVSGITGADLMRLPVPVPPLGTQRAIAEILGAFDDKIEVNRKLSATLEAVARAIFKSWFVDFDPVRAKAEGRPTGLPADVEALFPDRFEDSALGPIPAGWRVAAVGDVAEVVGGSTPSTAEPAYWVNGTYCWATPKDLAPLTEPVLIRTEKHITHAGLQTISSGLLASGTLLMSSRAPIGYLAIAATPVAINQGFIAMRPQEPISGTWLYLWLRSAMERVVARANGSTFLEISKANFRPIQLVHPDSSTLAAFNALAEPLFARIENSARNSESLAQMRDILLPKLISGEIRVPEAERAAAAGGL